MNNEGKMKKQHLMEDRGAAWPEMKNENGKQMDKFKMAQRHHAKTLWIYWSLILLGIWVFLSPFTFSYFKGWVIPAGGREVWLDPLTRSSILKWNDIVSGILLIIFGLRSLKANRPVSLWLACLVGTWLSAAPLIFWAPNPMVYLNDTFVGMVVIALTIIIPGMPNMILMMKMGPEQPPGWSYNPSSWPQRFILIALGFLGWMVSRYLTAYQLGYIDHAYDPFFGESSRLVLTSKMSRSFPISDAGLGALAYTFEFLMGGMGGTARWRTMPWMVLLFGILVIPLGLVHIFLVISQPLTVGHWCFMCLLAASIMLPMIPLEIDEVTAMLQFLKSSVRNGKPLWRTFWKGDTVEAAEEADKRSPEMASFAEQPGAVLRSSILGISFSRQLVLTSLLGVWLIVSPYLMNSSKSVMDVGCLAGALVVTFSVIAMAEVVRIGRFLNLVPALYVLISPLLINVNAAEGANYIITAIVVIILTIPKGPIREKYGAWSNYIR